MEREVDAAVDRGEPPDVVAALLGAKGCVPVFPVAIRSRLRSAGSRSLLTGVPLAGLAGVVTATALASGALSMAPATSDPAASGPSETEVSGASMSLTAYDVTGLSAVREEALDRASRSGTRQSAATASPTTSPTTAAADAASGRVPEAATKSAAATKSTGAVSGTSPSAAKATAKSMVSARGWGSGQYSCLVSLWTKESGWDYRADNPTSSAFGIPQALPGSKMASAGSDWQTNPATQISWGLGYIDEVYGTPCSAWAHSRSHNWY